MMQHKTCDASFKLGGEPGEFSATFATLNVIDKDVDVIVPGAFTDGAPVRIAAWGHNWNVPAVGRGVIHADSQRAWVDGQFFLSTEAGRQHYETVKGLAALQEWSFGYNVIEGGPGKWQGKDVRILRKLEVPEVSPVMLAAGLNTRTDAIKGYRDRRAHNLPTPGDIAGELDILEVEARLAVAERKSAAITSAPATRGETFVMQEMARDGISHSLAAARLGIAINARAFELADQQPWRFPHYINAYRAVAAWWSQPF